jgi:hypothetical protein
VVDISWHADGDGQGLWYSWSVDDCSTGSKKFSFDGFPGGYDIFRKASADPDYYKIASIPDNQTNFTDINLNDGSYSYFVTQSSSECSERIASDTILVDVVTGMQDLQKKKIRVFPNPSRNYITIETDEPATSVEIFDNSGKCILSFANIITKPLKLNLNSLSPGIYLLKIVTPSRIYTQKQIILN